MKKIIFFLIIIMFLGAGSAWAETVGPTENDDNDPVLLMINTDERIEPVPFRRSDLRAAEKSIKEMIWFLESTKYKIDHRHSNVVIKDSIDQINYILSIIEREKELQNYIQDICQKDQNFNLWWKNKQLEKSLESNANFREFYHPDNNPLSYSNIEEDRNENMEIEQISDQIICYYPTQIRAVALEDGTTLYTNLVCSTLEN